MHDQIERTGLGGTIKFGHPDWEPSFWPSHLWNWTDIKCNFKNLSSHDFPNSSREMGLLEFYKLCIKQSLELQGLDPETFYSGERTGEELEFRRKWRACRRRYNFGAEERQRDVHSVGESHPNEKDDLEEKEEKFAVNLENFTNGTNYTITNDVKNVELEEYIFNIPLEDDSETLEEDSETLDDSETLEDNPETFPMKRKSEVLDTLHPPSFRRSSVICYKV